MPSRLRPALRSHVLALAALTVSLFIALHGCGGGGGGAAAVGTLSIVATDAPFARELVTQADIFVNKIQVHRSATEDSGFITIYEQGEGDDPLELNLLDLTGGITQPMIDAELPPGTYRQVRLFFADAFLELENGRQYSVTDEGMLPLQLTSQATSGLKVFLDPPVQIQSGLTTTLLLDFDLSKTFRAIPANDAENANRYQLGPVIRATVTSTGGQLSGTVTDEGSGEGVEGVTVYLLPPGETDTANAITSTGTDATGAYAFLSVEPGTYDVLADDGERTARVDGASVTANNTTTVDLVLPQQQ